MKRILVESSNINAIGYDEETKTLEVQFKNGGVYQYSEVPKEIAEEMLKAESKGKYLAKNIKPIFSWKKVVLKNYVVLKMNEGKRISVYNSSVAMGTLKEICDREKIEWKHKVNDIEHTQELRIEKEFYEKYLHLFIQTGYERVEDVIE